MRRVEKLYFDIPFLRPGAVGSYVFAVIAVALATLFRIAIAPIVEPLPYLTYFPAVFIVALTSGTRAGLLSIVLSGVAVDFFFLEPKGAFSVLDRTDFAGLVLFVLNSAIAVALVGALRRAVEGYREANKALEHRLEIISESEEWLRLALEGADLGSYDVDLTTGMATWNRRHAVLLGYSNAPAPATLEAWLSAVHPADAENVRRAFEHARPEKCRFAIDHRLSGPLREARWISLYGRFRFDQSGKPIRLSGVSLDITERKRAEAQIITLLAEVNHRSKNMLAVVCAIARQTAASPAEDFSKRFGERIQALAASQDLLVNNEWKGVSLEGLILSQLAPFPNLIGSRVKLKGPPLTISARAVQNIGMAVHELATNAGKYGALSNTRGDVNIDWSLDCDADRTFGLSWIEKGGPPVAPARQAGFGTRVISSVIEQSLGAEVELAYAQDGFRWKMSCPAESVIELNRTDLPLETVS